MTYSVRDFEHWLEIG